MLDRGRCHRSSSGENNIRTALPEEKRFFGWKKLTVASTNWKEKVRIVGLERADMTRTRAATTRSV